jgi:hypothetical protein
LVKSQDLTITITQRNISQPNNFVISIQKILPIQIKLSNKQAHLRELLPFAKDECTWMSYIIDAFLKPAKTLILKKQAQMIMNNKNKLLKEDFIKNRSFQT